MKNWFTSLICIILLAAPAPAYEHATNFSKFITETNVLTVTVRDLIPSRAATYRYNGTISNTGTNVVVIGAGSLPFTAGQGWGGRLLTVGETMPIPTVRTLPDGTVIAWPGAYYIVLTNAGSASVSVSETFEDSTIAAPIASFTLSSTNGQAPLLVTIVDTSIGNITNRLWTFNSGNVTNILNTTSARFIWSFDGPSTTTVSVIEYGPGGSSAYTNAAAVTTTNSIDQPLIGYISPTNGWTSAATPVTVRGAFFDTNAIAKLGSVAVTLSVSNTTLATFTTPASTNAGYASLTLTNASGLYATLTNAFYFNQAPVVASLTPTNGFTNTTTAVTVAGAGFHSNITARFGSTAATVAWSDAGNLTITAPAAAGLTQKTVQITLTNPDGGSIVSSNAFAYVNRAPVVASLTPTNDFTNLSTSVSLTGSSFMPGAVVTFGTNIAASTFVSAASITATSPTVSTQSIFNVTVTNPDGKLSTRTNAFNVIYRPPQIAILTPTNNYTNLTTVVAISGSSFLDGCTVTFGGQNAAVTSSNASLLIVEVPATNTAGAMNVTVTNPDGQTVTRTNGFTAVER
jgi:hypothetical protein